MKFTEMRPLNSFKNRVYKELLSSWVPIIYPKGMNNRNWDKKVSEAIGLNEDFLEYISKKNGVYAIFKNDFLVYVGHTAAAHSRERLRNHLFKKHAKTGAKLDNVIEAISKNYKIYVSFVEIEPGALRHFIEERLIQDIEPDWNIDGKRRKK